MLIHLLLAALCLNYNQYLAFDLSLYTIKPRSYDESTVIRCGNTPKLTYGVINSIEKATQSYYEALPNGRLEQDKDLADDVPPASILGNTVYLDLMVNTMDSQSHRGSKLMIINHCDLFKNNEWIKDIFKVYLKESTTAVRAVLDIIHKTALCIDNKDPEYNCPDPCRTVPADFCSKKLNILGVCSAFLETQYRDLKIEYDSNRDTLKESVKTFLQGVKPDLKIPQEFFTHNVATKRRFFNRISFQLAVLKKPYCPCVLYHKYDEELQVCLPSRGELGCVGPNPCSNGGECTRVRMQVGSQTKTIAKCICPAAYRGDTCEAKNDQCLERNLCGKFKCVWDAFELETGYRCICPPTHHRKTTVDPTCVLKPVCGIESSDQAFEDNINMPSPCRNGGHCLQDPENPLMYECACPEGYTGTNCEKSPPEAVWAEWADWSGCILPDIAELCYQRPYRERPRDCISYSQAQRCMGPRRQLSYDGCDLDGDGAVEIYRLDRSRLNEMKSAMELCDYAGSRISPATETDLDEPLMSINSLDDWSFEGPEEAPSTALNNLIQTLEKQPKLVLPESLDLLVVIAWVMLVPLHVGMIWCWIFHIDKWRKIIVYAKKKYDFEDDDSYDNELSYN